MFIIPLPHKSVLDQTIFTDKPKYIGNAVADATGVRFHEFPLIPGRVLAGLKAADKA